MPIDLSKLENHLPKFIYDQLPNAIRNGEVTDEQYKNRLTHFISQCAHESQNFTRLTENLNYSYEGLLKTFKKYFTPTEAADYAHQPERIANRIYASRMGNGDESSGDGFRFRGRGALQLTGKQNYYDLDNFIHNSNTSYFGVVAKPELVATDYALLSATWFFDKNNIWQECDYGGDDNRIKVITRMINGGIKGLDERIKLFRKFEQILNSSL